MFCVFTVIYACDATLPVSIAVSIIVFTTTNIRKLWSLPLFIYISLINEICSLLSNKMVPQQLFTFAFILSYVLLIYVSFSIILLLFSLTNSALMSFM